MNPRVLIFSRDSTLLQTRMLILGAFFDVQGAQRIQETETLMVRRRYDLIILCYTLSQADCQRVLNLSAGQRPRPKILVLNAPGHISAPYSDDTALMTDAGSYYLLKRTAEMLGVDLQARGVASAAASA